MENKDHEKLNKVMQKHINRLMVGCLDIIEFTYSKKDNSFAEVRAKILRIGNDQKRDVEEFLENYITRQEFTLLMEFKEKFDNRGKE